MKSLNQINLIIADDNPAFVEALRFFLSKFDVFNIMEICKNGKELVDSKNLDKADLLLIDIQMPVMDGFQAAKLINWKCPKLAMISITMNEGEIYLQELIQCGFNGYVHKTQISKTLVDTINKVMQDKFVFPLKSKIKF